MPINSPFGFVEGDNQFNYPNLDLFNELARTAVLSQRYGGRIPPYAMNMPNLASALGRGAPGIGGLPGGLGAAPSPINIPQSRLNVNLPQAAGNIGAALAQQPGIQPGP